MNIFSFDIQRNYDPNDVQEYLKHLNFLKKHFPKFTTTSKIDSKIRSKLEWASLQISTEKIPYEWKKGKFYVFFEMPERCQQYYNAYKIPYLNFMIPKLRFDTLPECYMLESNLELPEDIFLNHIVMPKVTTIPEYSGKTLILGQMTCDRTTIFEGIPKSVFDYPVIGDIFRPHPKAKLYQADHYEKECLRATELGLELDERTDVYNVLHSVKKAVGISSGALYEASLFGTEVQFLDEKDYINRAKLIEKKRINRNFWNLVLNLV